MQLIKLALRSTANAISTINRYIGYGVSLLVLVFGGIMLWEAISRYFFGSPTTWAFEVSKMVFGIYMVWGGAYTLLNNEHVSMDLFYDKWPPRAQAAMDAITYIFFLILFLTLIKLTGEDAKSAIIGSETSNSTLSQPLYHWRVLLVLGVILVLLQGTAAFIRNLWLAISGDEL